MNHVRASALAARHPVKRLRLPFALLACLTLPVSWGQTPPSATANATTKPLVTLGAVVVTAPTIEGKTIDGNPFKLASLKGKVVLVMFWSTGCAVCRDKMPELRNNYSGWAGKPFEIVVINTDQREQDFLDYAHIISTTVPIKQRFVQLWTGDSGYKDNIGKIEQLPTSFLIDKNGKVVERYTGRIPAEAWDKIADLL